MRIGRWADAVAANVAAWRADVADAAACQSPYEPEHNTDMLVYAANMVGQVRTPSLEQCMIHICSQFERMPVSLFMTCDLHG